MNGGEDEDGTLREDVPIAPPVVQPHIERERCRAAAENRMSFVVQDAYSRLPLTGAFQSIFPWYRQRFSFGCLGSLTQAADTGSAIQPAGNSGAASLEYRRNADLFQLGEDGAIHCFLDPSGTECTKDDIENDAKLWASLFSYDARNMHCSNHEHDCKETCVKYVKKRLEAQKSLWSNKEGSLLPLLVLPREENKPEASPSTWQAARACAIHRSVQRSQRRVSLQSQARSAVQKCIERRRPSV